MPDPTSGIATATLLKLAGVGAGLNILDRFLTHVQTRGLRRLQSQTLDQMTTFNNDLLRRARGKFTDAEIAQIRRNNEPMVNAVAGNVAARGLGSSAAGASVITEAQQRPFFAAQDAATQAVPGSLQNLMSLVNQNLSMFAGDEGVAQEFGGLIQSYMTLKGLGGMPGQGYDGAWESQQLGDLSYMGNIPQSRSSMFDLYQQNYPNSPNPYSLDPTAF